MANSETALPWQQIAVLGVGEACHYFAICSLFSYVGIMSVDLGWASDRDSAGFVAGFLPSAAMFGRALTSPMWGFFANRYGFKPALLVTYASLLIGGILFGLSTSLPLSLAARGIFLGMLNCQVTLVGPLALRIGGPSRQAEVIAKVFSTGTFIQLFGPTLGGITYGIVPGFPALIPSWVGALGAVGAFVSCWRWLPDLRPSEPAASKASVDHSRGDDEESADSKQGPVADKQEHSLCSVLLSRTILLIWCMRILNGFSLMVLFEVVPLWAISTKRLGGLELSQQEVGWMLARSAAFNIVYYLHIMPALIKRCGNRLFGSASSVFCAILYVAMPYSPGVYTANVAQMLIVSLAASQEIIAITCTNNAAPAERLTSVTGVLVMSETFAKALGPVCAATGFAWTLDHWGSSGHGVAFFFVAAAHVVWALLCTALPSVVDEDPSKCPHEQKMIMPVKLGKSENDPCQKSTDEENSLANIIACEDANGKPLGDKSKREKMFNTPAKRSKLCYQKLSVDDNSSQVVAPQDHNMLLNEALRGA